MKTKYFALLLSALPLACGESNIEDNEAPSSEAVDRIVYHDSP